MQKPADFSSLIDQYDGFILDIWGVIHNGVRPYPGAVECLAMLRDAGKRSVLLSNAPRRAAVAQIRLREMGITDDLYTGIMTSGEATYLTLHHRSEDWVSTLGPRMFHLGPQRDRSVFDGIAMQQVSDPNAADWILNTGPDDDGGPTEMADHEPLLQNCAARRLPMLCANPDLEVVRGNERLLCAGSLANRYQELGGTVHALGKPDPAIYRPVLDMLGLPATQVLAVGDSLRTDIAGAKAAGIDSCWILGGIYAHDPEAEQSARKAGLSPRFILDWFR